MPPLHVIAVECVAGPEAVWHPRIAGLPDDFRHALVAVDVAGLSYREAADLLGTREATIASRVYRGRERVVRGLSPDMRSPSGEAGAPARSLR